MPLERRAPWDQAETEAIIDHREAPGGKIQALAVDARDRLAFHCRMIWQAGVRTAPCCCRLQLASPERVEEIAREDDALTLAPSEPLPDKVLDASVHRDSNLPPEAI